VTAGSVSEPCTPGTTRIAASNAVEVLLRGSMGTGGTAGVYRKAIAAGKPVLHLDPDAHTVTWAEGLHPAKPDSDVGSADNNDRETLVVPRTVTAYPPRRPRLPRARRRAIVAR
jgi:hypothetical protein